MSEENIPQVDLEAGVVTLKYGDETTQFKLGDAGQVENLVKLAQKGQHFDKKASVELGQLRQVIKNWDSAIEAARKDDGAMEQLIEKLEGAVGRPLTRAEKREMDKGDKPRILLDDEEDSRLQSTIESLQEEISQLKKSQADFKAQSQKAREAQIMEELNSEAARLEKKYSGSEGSPKFDRDEVFKFAAENRIENLELAYKMRHFDALTKAAKTQAIKELKDQSDKRKSGFTERGDSPPNLEGPKKSFKSWHEVGDNALKNARDSGKSLFITDE